MWSVQFNPDVHRIHTIELTRHLQRELGRDDIFVYRHEETENWVVAVWLRPGLLFMELLLVRHPSDVTRDNIHFLKEWAAGKTATLKDFARQEAERQRQSDREWMDENREAAAQKRFLGNQQNEVQRTHPFWDQPGFARVGVD